jgi:orotate phosphoribosyltransferase
LSGILVFSGPGSVFDAPVTSAEAIEIFRDTGALLEGHFILRSGVHSRQYFQCALALQSMPTVERFGAALADAARPLAPETVIAPALGGLVIGQEVARQLARRFIFAEKENGRLALRRGFTIRPGERVLVVEDVITQGGRVRETIEIVRARAGLLVGVAVLVDRSDATPDFGVPLFSVLRMKVETHPADRLPADLAAVPAVKPGSR